MKYELVHTFIHTLLFSWGSEAPPEAIWAANDFLKVLEDMYNYKFINEFSESYNNEFPDNNLEAVMEEINNLLNQK